MYTIMRGINPWLWPYMFIVMYNELNKDYIACQAIMLAERIIAYTFLINFLFEHVPGRQPEDGAVYTGDIVFSQRMLCNLGFHNVRYLHDWYHLFDSGLQDPFGKGKHDVINRELSLMIPASTEAFFNKAHNNAWTL